MELITNRTIGDVERWRALHDRGWDNMSTSEQTEWMGEMKGRYAYTDMNRVENAVQTLSERLRELGYPHGSLTIKTNWNRSDLPSVDDMERYYGNVSTLRRAITVYPTTPAAPTVEQRLDYQRANNLEQILFDIDKITNNIPKALHYANDIFAGEV